MPISDADLLAQYRRAEAEWPWIAAVERAVKLPPMLLWAVGSRDQPPQRDRGRRPRDRDLAAGPSRLDVARQRRVVPRAPAPPNRGRRGAAAGTAGQARRLARRGRRVQRRRGRGAQALAAGVDPDSRTTGGDYAADVESRRVRLLTMTGHPAAPATTTRSAMPATMLSRHFSTAEFACRHCGDLPPGGVSGALLAALEVARERHHPGGLTIASGYRCPQHRLSQASPRSRHTRATPRTSRR